MKRNRIIHIFSILIIAIGMFSCADLDVPTDGRVTLEDMFSKYPLAKNFYNSCRNYMPQVGFTYSTTPLASYCDEAHDASDNVAGGVQEWYTNRTSPTWNPITARDANGDPWDRYFRGINQCNIFLASISDPAIATFNFKGDEKEGWIAEVRVLRAFYYLQLIKRYGGVPLMDRDYEVTHNYANEKRATFEECADYIIAECDAALATEESEGRAFGLRWTLANDSERSHLTRGFAHAVRSQTALFAASPLWYTTGSKYTWERATAITKEALDACLEHGYELYNTPVDPDIAQNPYAWYFINRSDANRSVDKETIYETTSWRTNVWQYGGTPITDGMVKAGPCPSQELVDCYEMADGTQPILGYSDADHLIPILNPASSYDPANPYVNRDPRFYASIYYNGSPRTLTPPRIYTYPMHPSDPTVFLDNGEISAPANATVTENGDYFHLEFTGGANLWPKIHEDILEDVPTFVKFEYKHSTAVAHSGQFIIWLAPYANWWAYTIGDGFFIPGASDWTPFEIEITDIIRDPYYDGTRTWGKAGDFFRWDIYGLAGNTMDIRNFRIEQVVGTDEVLVETHVGGNCGISDQVTDTRYTRTGYYMRKFNNYQSGPSYDADGYMKIFRLGELYLNFAEAAYQANGPDAQVASTVGGSPMSAREAVNAIRKRADMPELPSGMSVEDFEKRYRNERRVELAFEEHRFFDVRRWKILNETDNFVTGMRISKNADNTFTYNRVKLAERNTHTEKYLMFPIKQEEVLKMEANTGDVWQNPWW